MCPIPDTSLGNGTSPTMPLQLDHRYQEGRRELEKEPLISRLIDLRLKRFTNVKVLQNCLAHTLDCLCWLVSVMVANRRLQTIRIKGKSVLQNMARQTWKEGSLPAR